jgi:hypothetical protein
MARIRGFLKRLFHRSPESTEVRSETAPTREVRRAEPAVARPVQRSSDIPMDIIEHTYTPPITSSKASFRSDGSDHARDQDFITHAAEDRWNDEDRLTNKSGDPRIGTHGRGDSRTQEESNER